MSEQPDLEAVQRAHAAWSAVMVTHRAGETPGSDALVEAARALSVALLDYAAVDLTMQPEREPVVLAMAETVEGPDQMVPRYLLARLAESRGDSGAMAALLEQALVAEPRARLPLADLSYLRSIAGNAAEALRLATQAGLDPADPSVAVLTTFLRPPEIESGRNRPCECGSGKKFKLCHGRDLPHPLSARTRWLLIKVVAHLHRPVNRELLLEWTAHLAGETPDHDVTLQRAASDPTAWDFALWDGGILERYVATFAEILPDDERALLERWASSSRGLYEAVQVHAGLNVVTLRDLQTGTVYSTRDKALSNGMLAKDLIFGRLLDDAADGHLVWGSPLGLPRMMRAPLLGLLRSDPDPREVAQFLSPRGPVALRPESEGVGDATQQDQAAFSEEEVVRRARELEDQWLAQRVPALGDLTPAEAAADPTHRGELSALLDDFEWTNQMSFNRVQMDVGRLRQELGL